MRDCTSPTGSPAGVTRATGQQLAATDRMPVPSHSRAWTQPATLALTFAKIASRTGVRASRSSSALVAARSGAGRRRQRDARLGTEAEADEQTVRGVLLLTSGASWAGGRCSHVLARGVVGVAGSAGEAL
jgi:hypothetical protein